ncbi:MAG: toxin-antitoxin system HicB family antitoxin [Acidobacteria bacterium]|nr:MAG: toxin-antitoxin system HicB family antitoxin [Acidobacteriota bacterium]
MQRIIQIRDVPESLHRKLRIRAAEKGQSLAQYLREELVEIANTPTESEIRERLRRLTPVTGNFSTAEIIRADRDSH